MANKIKRSINYYYLKVEYLAEFEEQFDDPFVELFRQITKLANDKSPERYQTFGEKAIFIQDIKFEPGTKHIVGKLRCVRKDLLPEIMDTLTDRTQGIEAKEEEGLVETTHFVIDYAGSKKKMAIEYNQFGAKIGDFLKYILRIGEKNKNLKECEAMPVVKDELAKMASKIKRCSEFKVKVHKDNIAKIEDLDTGIFTALESSIDQFKCEYSTLILKFDYKNKTESGPINDSILGIIQKLIKDKSRTRFFQQLVVRAENVENNNKLELFDLLIDKVKSELIVEKKERYRTIVSEDILSKMKQEMTSKSI